MAFTGKDPKDTYLALLNLGDANETLPATTPTETVLDAAGNSSLLGLSQNTIEFIGILLADVASGMVIDTGIAFEADAVSVDSVLNKSDNTVGVFFTSGDPEGSLTAGVGSLALRDDGVAGATLYVKESGTGNTGWVAYDFVTNFLDLGDTPGAFSADKWLKVDGTGNFLEWSDAPLGAFTDLSDTPDPLVAGKWMKVNAGGTAIEFTDDPTAAATTFINLPDTPASYVSGKWLQTTGSEIVFVDAPPMTFDDLTDTNITALAQGEILYYDGADWVNLGVGVDGYVLSTQGAAANPTWVSITSISTFVGLADTPGTFTADKWLKVDGTGNFIEWVDNTLLALEDVNITTPVQGEMFFFDGSDWIALPVGSAGQFLTTQGAGANPTWGVSTFDGLDDTIMTTPAQGEVLFFDGTDWINLGVGTDGYVLTTHGAAADPDWADASSVSTFAGLSDTIITTPAQGEVLYFDGSDWLNLAVGTDGDYLTTHGAASNPTWTTPSSGAFADLTDTVITTPAQGEVLFFDGSDWVNLAVGADGYYLTTHGAASDPTWVAPGTGGTLAALDDTNITAPAHGGILYFDGSDWVDMSVGTSGYLLATQGSGAAPIWVVPGAGLTFAALDDTVMTTPAQGEVLYFDGTDWVNLGVGTNGHFLTTHGAASNPTWSSASAGSTFAGLSDTIITTPAQGEVLFFDGSDWVNLGVGTEGYVLTTHGASSNPTWVEGGGGGSDLTAIHDNVADEITAITPKTTLDDADELLIEDSGASFVKKAVALSDLKTYAGGGGDYLPLVGGTLTGDLLIDKTLADLSFEVGASGELTWRMRSTTADFELRDMETSYGAFKVHAGAGDNLAILFHINQYGVSVGTPVTSSDGGELVFYLEKQAGADLTMAVEDDGSYGFSDKAGSRHTAIHFNSGAMAFGDAAATTQVNGSAGRPTYKPGAGSAVDIALLLSGTGSPQGSVTANVGDFYIDTSGGVGAVLYVKAVGTDSSGWDLVTTSAAS
jgi:hypothetical protein